LFVLLSQELHVMSARPMKHAKERKPWPAPSLAELMRREKVMDHQQLIKHPRFDKLDIFSTECWTINRFCSFRGSTQEGDSQSFFSQNSICVFA
jgi:hypothetical protein